MEGGRSGTNGRGGEQRQRLHRSTNPGYHPVPPSQHPLPQSPHRPFAALILAHDATVADTVRIAESAAAVSALGAQPVVVALPAEVAPLTTGVRVVRTKSGAPAIAAIRLGMAQLTNTAALSVVLVPLAAIPASGPSLDAMLERSARLPSALVALEGVALDASPLVVPRSSWLELMTLGEQGIQAVAGRVGVEWVQ